MSHRTSRRQESGTSSKDSLSDYSAIAGAERTAIATMIITIPFPGDLPLLLDDDAESRGLSRTPEQMERQKQRREQINARANLQRHAQQQWPLHFGRHQFLRKRKKPEWKLPAVMPTEDAESLKQQLGTQEEMPRKLEWKLPAVMPQDEPRKREPEIDDSLEPGMLP